MCPGKKFHFEICRKIETNKMANKLVKTEAAWEKFFEKADVNSDGSVSIDELKHILTVEYQQKLSDREIAVSVQINHFSHNCYRNYTTRFFYP